MSACATHRANHHHVHTHPYHCLARITQVVYMSVSALGSCLIGQQPMRVRSQWGSGLRAIKYFSIVCTPACTTHRSDGCQVRNHSRTPLNHITVITVALPAALRIVLLRSCTLYVVLARASPQTLTARRLTCTSAEHAYHHYNIVAQLLTALCPNHVLEVVFHVSSLTTGMNTQSEESSGTLTATQWYRGMQLTLSCISRQL